MLHPLKILAFEEHTFARTGNPAEETLLPLGVSDETKLCVDGFFEVLNVVELDPTQLALQEGEEEKVTGTQVGGIGGVRHLVPLYHTHVAPHQQAPMRPSVIHVQHVLREVLPDAPATPCVNAGLDSLQQSIKDVLVHVHIREVLSVDQTTCIKEWHHQYLCACPGSPGNLWAILILLQPGYVLIFAPGFIHMKVRLICGHHPLQASWIPGVILDEILTEHDSVPLLGVGQLVWNQLASALGEHQVFVQQHECGAIRNGQSSGELVDPDPLVPCNQFLALLHLVLGSGSLGFAASLQVRQCHSA